MGMMEGTETVLGKWTWGSQEVQATRVNFSSLDSGQSQHGGEEVGPVQRAGVPGGALDVRLSSKTGRGATI